MYVTDLINVSLHMYMGPGPGPEKYVTSHFYLFLDMLIFMLVRICCTFGCVYCSFIACLLSFYTSYFHVYISKSKNINLKKQF